MDENDENADANAAAAAARPIVRVVNRDAIKIEKFGDGNFDRWLRRFEVCATAYGWDADARLLYLPTYLKDRAWVVFEHCEEQEIEGYDDLVAALRKVFGTNTREKRMHAHRLLEARKFRRGCESVDEYAHDLEKLLERAMPTLDRATREDQLMQRFVAGLPSSLRYELEVNPPATFEATIEKTEDLRLLEDRRREEEDAAAARPGWERRPPLRGSQQGGFRAAAALSRGVVGERRVASVGVESDGADLHERMTRLELLIEQIALGRALPTSNAAESLNAGEQVCYRCGQTGHYVGNCSVRDGRRCFNCNEVGHIARQCPREKRQGNGGITEHKVSVVNVETRRGEANGPIIACAVVDPLIAVGKIGTSHAAYLIDTGATVSLCSRSFADKNAMKPATPRSIVRAAAGGEIPIIGCCEMVVKIGELEARHEFWVTSALLANPIIGLDFMRPRGVKIDTGTGELWWNAGRISLETPTPPREELVAKVDGRMLGSFARQLETLQETVSEELRAKKELVKQRSRADKELKEMRCRLEGSRKVSDDLAKAVKDLQLQCRRMQAAYDDEVKARKSLEESRARAKRKCGELQGEIEDLRASRKQAKRVIKGNRKVFAEEVTKRASNASSVKSRESKRAAGQLSRPKMVVGAKRESAAAEDHAKESPKRHAKGSAEKPGGALATKRIAVMKAERERSYDERMSEVSAFEEGDVVYLYVPSVKRGQAEKLSRHWEGPFVVERVYDAVDAKIRPIGGGSAQRVQMGRLEACDRSSMVALQREESRRRRGDPVSESEDDEDEGDFEVIFEEPEARIAARGRREDPLVELLEDELTDINDEDEELESEPDSEGEEADEDGAEAAPMVEARPRRNAGPPVRLRDYVVDFESDDEQ